MVLLGMNAYSLVAKWYFCCFKSVLWFVDVVPMNGFGPNDQPRSLLFCVFLGVVVL